MLTCYIFSEHFNDENCLSVRLDEQGNVEQPLQLRSIEDFKKLQENSKTIVVLPTHVSCIHELELPYINERKARPALTYALEDKLAQPVTNLHFSFDKEHYENNRYLILVTDKQIISDLKAKLVGANIKYNVITNEWFSLNIGEACVIESSLLVNDINFKGALSIDLLDKYLGGQASFSHVLKFTDSQVLQHSEKFTQVDMDSYNWVATQLFKKNPMNFCQGEFQHNTHKDSSKRWYKLAIILGSVWVCGLILTNLVSWLVLDNQLSDYDKKIAVVYREFFPNAKQVISPKFRINQLLKKNESGYDARIWKLLANLSAAVHPDNLDKDDYVSIQQLKFQNSNLSVRITSHDFYGLEKLALRLKKLHVTVRKSSAATKGDKVIATLELS
ncbi:MAG: type II secretion system protein GspL [Legionellaceae bacterium]|nr:type II secretion system protein GspL [Legionellaceae bacterium]